MNVVFDLASASSLRGVFLINVEVTLWERNADTFYIEAFLHDFLEVALEFPEIRGLRPRPHHKVDAAVSQFRSPR